MNKEGIGKKSHEISNSDRTRLSIIALIHHHFGNRSETHLPVDGLRLRYLLFLADYEYFYHQKQTYLGAWIYANGGPVLQGLSLALADLDGLEIYKTEQGFVEGKFNRYSTWRLDPFFENILLKTKQQHFFTNNEALGNLVYAAEPMKNTNFGDFLFS
jgi:hypothetical protein